MTTTLSASMMILAWGSLLGLGLRRTLACRLGRSLTLLQTFKAMHPITETVYVTNFRPHLQMRLRSMRMLGLLCGPNRKAGGPSMRMHVHMNVLTESGDAHGFGNRIGPCIIDSCTGLTLSNQSRFF